MFNAFFPNPSVIAMAQFQNFEQIAQHIKDNHYDFLDFGCANGESLEVGQQQFQGKKGLGIDIDPQKVKKAIANGYDAITADITLFNQAENLVRFVLLSHFLEHLSGFKQAQLCVNIAINAASEFVMIRQPWFDSDSYLFRQGLKLYWSDWTGHPNSMTSLEFHRILSNNPQVHWFGIYGAHKILSFNNKVLHPITSPKDQHHYIKGKHPTKPFSLKPLAEPVFREIVVLIQIDPQVSLSNFGHILSCELALYESDGFRLPLANTYLQKSKSLLKKEVKKLQSFRN